MSTRPNGSAATGATDQDSSDWNEEQLEAALKRLKELHVQLRNLRSTIPRMVQPFMGPSHPPPELLYATCRASMIAAINEVKEFKQVMISQETQNDIEHAKQSKQKNPTDIKPWRASDEPDWTNVNS